MRKYKKANFFLKKKEKFKAQLERLTIDRKNIFSIKPREERECSFQICVAGPGRKIKKVGLGLLIELRGKAVRDIKGAGREF